MLVVEQRKGTRLHPAVAARQRDLRLQSEYHEEEEDINTALSRVCCRRTRLRLMIVPAHHRTRPCVAVERRVQMAL